jgi:hypothetical protein
MADPYQTLGVAREATQGEIRKAYRRLAKKNHPDLHPGDKAAEARFKEIVPRNVWSWRMARPWTSPFRLGSRMGKHCACAGRR